MISRNNFHGSVRLINEEEHTVKEKAGTGMHWHYISVTRDPLELQLQNRIS